MYVLINAKCQCNATASAILIEVTYYLIVLQSVLSSRSTCAGAYAIAAPVDVHAILPVAVTLTKTEAGSARRARVRAARAVARWRWRATRPPLTSRCCCCFCFCWPPRRPAAPATQSRALGAGGLRERAGDRPSSTAARACTARAARVHELRVNCI